MRLASGILLALICQAETPTRLLTERLGQEADAFERSALRVIGTETLQQTLPAGFHVSKRGIETKMPERHRTVVSQYSYMPVDEKGGSLREARNVLTVDGLQWNKTKPLSNLAHAITARTDAQRRKLLEDFEDHGLAGIITDCSQSILLFARGNTAKYEFMYDGTEQDEFGAPLDVFRFQQIDGDHAFRVYENKGVVADKIRGKIWFRTSDNMPARIGMETVRQVKQSKMRDTVVITYQRSDFGTLLPSRVLHEQYENNFLAVINAFEYSDFKAAYGPSTSR